MSFKVRWVRRGVVVCYPDGAQRLEGRRGMLSLREAASLLGCDAVMLYRMKHLKRLKTVRSRQGLRVPVYEAARVRAAWRANGGRPTSMIAGPG